MMNPAEFNNIARAEEHFWWYRGMRRIMFRLFDPIAARRPIHRVLEAGCGTGHFARALQQRYGWSVYPIDLGWEGLEYGKQLGVSRLAQANIAALPFAPHSFDAVVSMDVIVHFPPGQEGGAMRELVRVLKPGGLLAVRVSALDILRSHHSQFAMERQRFTRSRLLRLVREHGIEVQRCTYANSLLMPVALAKFRIIEPLFGGEPSSGVEPVAPWLDKLLYAPLAVESAWLGAGLGLPLGQSLILIGEKKP
jgi:ubiquinone/menaquinone biosynthesis C-methylase UbiE